MLSGGTLKLLAIFDIHIHN